MKKISDIIQIFIFMVVIIGFGIATLMLPDKEFSEQENRVLSKSPALSLDEVKTAEYMKNIETYLTDQFPMRDRWISIKSYAEKSIGKTENNGTFLCKDGVLINKFDEPDKSLIDTNISAVNKLIANTNIPVYFSLIPGAVSVCEEKLPPYAQNYSQKELIKNIYSKINCNTIDNYKYLDEHDEEYIYYRTDHHWTSLGAYYGYLAIANELRLDAKKITKYKKTNVSNDFYGTIYSSSGVRWINPDSIDIYVPSNGKKVESIVGQNAIEGVFYNYDKLDIKDKYSFFFGGNAALLKVTSDCKNDRKLLVIRDSYSDCEMPFLTEHYSVIYMMDLRYYRFGVKNFINNNEIDEILINYSISNFSTDRSLMLLGN